MIKLEFDDNVKLNDVLDKLIFYKEVFNVVAYADFNGVRYLNVEIDELKNLKKLTNPLDRDIESMDNSLLNIFNTKMNCNKDLVFWINKAKELLKDNNKDEFEYECYKYITEDTNNYFTIKSAAYLLYIFESNPLAFEAGYYNEKTLEKIMLVADNTFNYTVFGNILLKYCSYTEVMQKLLNSYIPEIDYKEEYEKMKRLRIKLENK